MTCSRCQGCLQWEPMEYGDTLERRCINCGARPDNIPYPEPVRDPYSRRKCPNCRNTVTGTDYYCGDCRSKLREYARKRTRSGSP